MKACYYVLQHKKISSVLIWAKDLSVPGYMKFKSWISAFWYKLVHFKIEYKVVKKFKDITEIELWNMIERLWMAKKS